ncbi:MAG: DUF2796 domain-containing protein [Deltaproteobacteria bacterium]|jgi:hypothetical protein|nr:DUF2796 domain-containing protein [Deltaproteobacteria bacterium]
MHKKALALLAAAPFLAFLAPADLFAQGETHAPHVHGAATLNIAVEADSIDLDLDGPLASFISFEHAPSTPEQRAEMQKLADSLMDAGSLFSFPAAWGCRVSKAEIEGETIPEDILGHPHKAEGEGHGHGHEDGDHEHAEGEVHSDLEAEFVFACPSIASEVATLDASGLFKAFPNLQDLDVQLVSPKGQTGAELSPSSTSLAW